MEDQTKQAQAIQCFVTQERGQALRIQERHSCLVLGVWEKPEGEDLAMKSQMEWQFTIDSFWNIRGNQTLQWSHSLTVQDLEYAGDPAATLKSLNRKNMSLAKFWLILIIKILSSSLLEIAKTFIISC